MTPKEFEDIKNIIHGLNLDDDYFVNPDATENTGEISSKPTDANIFIKGKDIKPQLNKFRSAISKIYQGYEAAYDKEAYKKKFDIYPLKDFEQHMSELGAKRSQNGLDFEGTGDVVDWIKKVKDEIKTRLVEYKKREAERKKKEEQDAVDKEASKVNENLNKVDNQNIKNDALLIRNTAKNIIGFSFPPDVTDEEVVKMYINLSLNEYKYDASKFKGKLTKDQIHKLVQFVKQNPLPIKTSETDITSEESFKNTNRELKNKLEGSTSSIINKYKKDLEENKKKIENLKNDDSNTAVTETEKLNKQNIELEKKIKAAEENRTALYKGIIQTEKDHDDFQDTLKTTYERSISKYDGFTTQGPFCLEKRNYFKEIYRPSISHIDTEFREPIKTILTGKDEGNDIKKIQHQKGGAPVADEPAKSKDGKEVIPNTPPNKGTTDKDAVKMDSKDVKLQQLAISMMTAWQYVIFTELFADMLSGKTIDWQDKTALANVTESFYILLELITKYSIASISHKGYPFVTTNEGWTKIKNLFNTLNEPPESKRLRQDLIKRTGYLLEFTKHVNFIFSNPTLLKHIDETLNLMYDLDLA